MPPIQRVLVRRFAEAQDAADRVLVPTYQSVQVHESSWQDQFDQLITNTAISNSARDLFGNRHYSLAVEEAFKCLNNAVKSKSGLDDDGNSLMKKAFSVQNGRLKINDLKTQSQRDQQIGYMEIFAGAMTGIRNPRAHEHSYLDKPDVALELLLLANHLMRMVDQSVRRRVRSGVAKSH